MGAVDSRTLAFQLRYPRRIDHARARRRHTALNRRDRRRAREVTRPAAVDCGTMTGMTRPRFPVGYRFRWVIYGDDTDTIYIVTGHRQYGGREVHVIEHPIHGPSIASGELIATGHTFIAPFGAWFRPNSEGWERV